MPRGRPKSKTPKSPLTAGDESGQRDDLASSSSSSASSSARGRRDAPDLATCTLNLIHTLQDIPDGDRERVLQAALLVVGVAMPRSIVHEQERMIGVNGERARA